MIIARSVLHRLLRCLAAALLCASASLIPLADAAAGDATVVPIGIVPRAELRIEPELAVSGTLRQITLTGWWSDGCPPGSATLETLPGGYRVKVFILQTLVACTQVITPWKIDFKAPFYSLSGAEIESLPVEAVLSDGRVLDRRIIRVSRTERVSSRWDISGVWYAPATSGSGFFFAHGFAGSDQVFGAWNTFDSNGLPRWVSLQKSAWLDETTLSLTAYESRAQAAVCPPGVPLCSVRAEETHVLSALRLHFISPDKAEIFHVDAAGNALPLGVIERMAL